MFVKQSNKKWKTQNFVSDDFNLDFYLSRYSTLIFFCTKSYISWNVCLRDKSADFSSRGGRHVAVGMSAQYTVKIYTYIFLFMQSAKNVGIFVWKIYNFVTDVSLCRQCVHQTLYQKSTNWAHFTMILMSWNCPTWHPQWIRENLSNLSNKEKQPAILLVLYSRQPWVALSVAVFTSSESYSYIHYIST